MKTPGSFVRRGEVYFRYLQDIFGYLVQVCAWCSKFGYKGGLEYNVGNHFVVIRMVVRETDNSGKLTGHSFLIRDCGGFPDCFHFTTYGKI